MFEMFLHPWFAVAGAALISAPIIIHLINRMRFKRIRWAAMEFLLKSQKRNRRRLIIEQLILLALRCLLVLLAGVLVARFLGFSSFAFFQPQNTTHVVVLDDTLSMSDRWREQGEAKNSFDVAKGLIRDIARSASRAGSAQQLKLICLSEPGTILFDQRLNEETLRELSSTLDGLKWTYLHKDPLEGVEAAREILNQGVGDQRVLHVVSDFRNRDWAGPEATRLNQEVEKLSQAGVKVYLVDAAHPNRGDTRNVTLYHDNLGILDLRPETRVAAEGMPVQFTVTIGNFSTVEKKNVFLSIKVEGVERLEASVPIASLKPGPTKQTFMVGFIKTGFNQITATLDESAEADSGLLHDNKRFAVIEVRKQVPVLVIDGDPAVGTKPGGDTYHLQTVFTAAKGYQIVSRGVEELQRPTLDQYPCIYLCNVPEIKSEKALKNLEDYVQNGGSVAFFLGEKVKPDYYNKNLYKDGKGLFPAPLADRPTQALTEQERVERLLDDQLKIFVRDERYSPASDMPIFGPLLVEGRKYEGHFKFLMIDRYFPVPRLKWNPEPGRVEEFVTLPNQRAVGEYTAEAQRLLDALPLKEQKYETYQPALEEHARAIRTALSGKALFELANALRSLLEDKGDPKDPKKANLVEFWEQPDPKIRQLRAEVDKLRETVQYGDPLVIGNRYGKGRVVAFLTTAGKAWNDWPGGGPAAVTYPVVMLELHKYLTSVGAENDLTVGSNLEIALDSSRYEAKMHRYLEPDLADTGKADKAEDKEAVKKVGSLRDLGEQPGSITGNRVTFSFKEAREPGIYLFDLFPRATEQNIEAKPEQRAYVFNVDTAAEGDLKRANREDLERTPTTGKTISVAYPGAPPVLDQRQTDLSESPWFYLAILLILIAEQAMAVHLSFHLKGSEGLVPPQAVRPQASAA